MNILPKKRWHVRTKENVIRVRRDERKAAETAKAEDDRQKLAAQEARTRYLRTKAADRTSQFDPFANQSTSDAPAEGDKTADDKDKAGSANDVEISDASGHLNFFAELERQERTFGANKDAQAESKAENEEYEKKMGILKYLGDGSTEILGKNQPWWNKSRQTPKPEPPKLKSVESEPPPSTALLFPSDLAPAPKRLKREKKPKKEKKHKSRKRKREYSDSGDRKAKKDKKKKRRRSPSSSSSSSSVEEMGRKGPDMAALRAERRRREAAEKAKTDALLRKARGEPEPVAPTPIMAPPKPRKQQYSSQFNPEFARQNRRDDE